MESQQALPQGTKFFEEKDTRIVVAVTPTGKVYINAAEYNDDPGFVPCVEVPSGLLG